MYAPYTPQRSKYYQQITGLKGTRKKMILNNEEKLNLQQINNILVGVFCLQKEGEQTVIILQKLRSAPC